MDVRRTRQLALGIAGVAALLAGTMPWSYDDAFREVVVAAPLGVVWTLVVLVAVGGVVYAASSLAAEHMLHERRRIDRATGRQAARDVPETLVVQQVRDGVTTPEELADALGIHLHVARRMLEVLVADGRLVQRDGRVTTQDRPERSLPTGPRWIDPTG